MDINTFKILHSETIEFCQIIEGDLKWIYSLMHVGDIGENHSKLEKTTLGQVVSMLKELDKSSGEQFISDGDYNFLKQMTEKRNYWCHVCYRDFMYEENPLTSLAYKKARYTSKCWMRNAQMTGIFRKATPSTRFFPFRRPSRTSIRWWLSSHAF